MRCVIKKSFQAQMLKRIVIVGGELSFECDIYKKMSENNERQVTTKRKHENSLKEKKDETQKILVLIYHKGIEMVECHCGQIINKKHECAKKIKSKKLYIEECKFKELDHDDNDCAICEKDAKRKEYYSQWAVDFDGYDVCSTCHSKCPYGELPKECECPSDEEFYPSNEEYY